MLNSAVDSVWSLQLECSSWHLPAFGERHDFRQFASSLAIERENSQAWLFGCNAMSGNLR